ncbi:uncharacterized protein ACLA_044220 [Aspergillus clavatus NRRL 1]|uniref:Aminoglycoside phosphotransferase domain-containing protein n=1 Tax=Aspergillus clavatus (strain ATCC 1007 / CBS 513.65 / DSM 816 / NCTC 3887 / NRRL 1 / QM 1276 / 107) TaxID=344612 RepID=A1C8R5_ASPCL|nr:uncharacterized protein ACLA_044220 [Aspergillus clavatus NRRL 1]EAW13702.1 hypothetical protein ACLA_044220 [Aspergillus clavatus NRRL 1]
MPIHAFDLSGRGRYINGRPVGIDKQLTEELDPRFAQRSVLALATYVDTNEPVTLRIRYDLNPAPFGYTDPDEIRQVRERARFQFIEEIRATEEVGDIGHGASYLDHCVQKAGSPFPYPEGTVYFFVMTRVPGEKILPILNDLTDGQLEDVRKQLTFILERMRQCGFLLFQPNPDFLRYDRANEKLYLIDFAYISFTDPDVPDSLPITADSAWVLSFGLWRPFQLTEVEDSYPWETQRKLEEENKKKAESKVDEPAALLPSVGSGLALAERPVQNIPQASSSATVPVVLQPSDSNQESQRPGRA